MQPDTSLCETTAENIINEVLNETVRERSSVYILPSSRDSHTCICEQKVWKYVDNHVHILYHQLVCEDTHLYIGGCEI